MTMLHEHVQIDRRSRSEIERQNFQSLKLVLHALLKRTGPMVFTADEFIAGDGCGVESKMVDGGIEYRAVEPEVKA